MRVGTAYSTAVSSVFSGREVIRTAMADGGLERADLVLAFCSNRVDHNAFYEGMRSVVGPETPIIGGSAVGIITSNKIVHEDHAAGAMVMASDEMRLHVSCCGQIDQDIALCGGTLGRGLPDDPEARLLLLFYDSIKRPPTENSPPIMNASPDLIQGIEKALQSHVPVIGAGVLGDLAFQPTHQFCGDSVKQQAAVGVLMCGRFMPFVRIMHGCTPQDGIYHTITRANGAVIYEVDHRPIVDWIDEMYGNAHWRDQIPVRRMTIGVNHGDKYGDYNESCFVNRLIAGVLPQKDGIVLFEPDFAQGTEIMFMLRDAPEMIRSARENTNALVDQIAAEHRRPVCALYIDCAGRTAEFSETPTEEASEVVHILNNARIPLLGFYSGVEIAPMLGRSRGLDWTGVLIILAQ